MTVPLVSLRGITKSFGGLCAIDDVTVDLGRGEVVGLLGHNGAGKSTLMKILSGALVADRGEIAIDGIPVQIRTPGDAFRLGVGTIYQNLALAENLDVASNLYLGRELLTRFGTLDQNRMEREAERVLHRLNPHFQNLRVPVRALSGGQRQTIAIGRALKFDARVLVMDEPTAALGPGETAAVARLIEQLKADELGIFLVSHDVHDVFDLCDRVVVMKAGRLVGTGRVEALTKDEVLGMIILGACPKGAVPGPGASDAG